MSRRMWDNVAYRKKIRRLEREARDFRVRQENDPQEITHRGKYEQESE